VRRRAWDASKGASLRTYFIGACLLNFGKVYNKWWRGKVIDLGMQRIDPTDAEHPLVAVPDDRAIDPCDHAVARDQADRALAELDPQLRPIVALLADGYSQAEAAEHEGVTRKSVERRLARHRHKRRTDDLPAEPDVETEGGGQ
jgi:DNA-directed RNA polymerase specialized sigma24 family protein